MRTLTPETSDTPETEAALPTLVQRSLRGLRATYTALTKSDLPEWMDGNMEAQICAEFRSSSETCDALWTILRGYPQFTALEAASHLEANALFRRFEAKLHILPDIT